MHAPTHQKSTKMCYALSRAICLNPFPRNLFTCILKLIQTIGNVSHGPKRYIAKKTIKKYCVAPPPAIHCGGFLVAEREREREREREGEIPQALLI